MGAHDEIPLDSIPDLEDRLLSRIEMRGPDDCWNWTGGKTGGQNGHRGRYGALRHQLTPGRNGRIVRLAVHRLMYRLAHGDIPQGKMVCHRCDNPLCCNPHHLYAGTQADNMRDMVVRGRSTVGVKNPRAKLSEGDVTAIRRLRREGWTLKALGEKYGVHLSTIGLVCSGKNWGE